MHKLMEKLEKERQLDLHKKQLELNKNEKQKISEDPQPGNKIEFSCISTAISSQKQVACKELKTHPIMK